MYVIINRSQFQRLAFLFVTGCWVLVAIDQIRKLFTFAEGPIDFSLNTTKNLSNNQMNYLKTGTDMTKIITYQPPPDIHRATEFRAVDSDRYLLLNEGVTNMKSSNQ